MHDACDLGFDDPTKDVTSQAYSLQDLSRLQQVTELRKGLGVVNWWLKIDLLSGRNCRVIDVPALNSIFVF